MKHKKVISFVKKNKKSNKDISDNLLQKLMLKQGCESEYNKLDSDEKVLLDSLLLLNLYVVLDAKLLKVTKKLNKLKLMDDKKI